MKPSTSNLLSKTEVELELIKFVRENPCLYILESEEGKRGKNHRLYRDNIWQLFASKYGIDLKKLKDKWNILRTGFNSAFKRYESENGKGTKWKYLDEMLFLKDQIVTSELYENLKIEFDDEEHVDGEENELQNDLQEETDNESNITNNQTNDLPKKRSLDTGTSKSVDKFYYDAHNLNNSVKRPKPDQSAHQSTNQSIEDQTDPIMMFLRSLVPTLKRYKDSQLNIVKYKILAVLIEADQEFLRDN